MDFEEIFSWLGKLVLYGGGSVGIAFLAFRTFSENWLQSRFAKGLESFRHENDKELAKLKAKIDGKLSATIRIQEKEFSALSECHDLMNQAYGAAQTFVSPLQSYQDLRTMPVKMRVEYVSGLDLMQSQKDEILEADEPQKKLQEAVFWIKRNAASKAQIEFNNAIFRNEIYIEEMTADDFKKVARSLREAITSRELSREDSDRKLAREAWNKVQSECHAEIERLTKELRSKFFDQKGPRDPSE